jgi:spore germination cell wall hydrolase CwlJ-like protein
MAAFSESELVARQVLLENFRLPSLKDALYFHADYVKPNRPADKKLAQIGRHIFYK